MSADTGSCRACGRALPQARRAGRPRRYCSSTCRSAGRRARVRDAALLSRHGGPCTAELVGPAMPQARGVHPVRQRGAVPVLFRLLHRDGPVPAGSAHTRLRTRDSRTCHTGPATCAGPGEDGPEGRGAGDSRRGCCWWRTMKQSGRLCASRSLARATKPWRVNRTCRAAQRLSAAARPGRARCHASGHRRYGSAAQAAYRQRRPGHLPHSTQRPHRRDRRTGDRCGRLHRQAVPGQGDRCPDQARAVPLPRSRAPGRRCVRRRAAAAGLSATAGVGRGRPLPLSRTEFRILDRLVRHTGAVQHFGTLLEAGWGAASPGARDRVKFTVSRLRGKLDATPVGGGSIVSVRGMGYLYRSPTTPALPPSPKPAAASTGYGHTHALHDGSRAQDRAEQK